MKLTNRFIFFYDDKGQPSAIVDPNEVAGVCKMSVRDYTSIILKSGKAMVVALSVKTVKDALEGNTYNG